MNTTVDYGKSHRLNLLYTLTHVLGMAHQATVDRDEQALEDSVRKITSAVEAFRGTNSSDNVILSDEEMQMATVVRNSARKLGKLTVRMGEVQRTRLRMIRLQGTDGYGFTG